MTKKLKEHEKGKESRERALSIKKRRFDPLRKHKRTKSMGHAGDVLTEEEKAQEAQFAREDEYKRTEKERRKRMKGRMLMHEETRKEPEKMEVERSVTPKRKIAEITNEGSSEGEITLSKRARKSSSPTRMEIEGPSSTPKKSHYPEISYEEERGRKKAIQMEEREERQKQMIESRKKKSHHPSPSLLRNALPEPESKMQIEDVTPMHVYEPKQPLAIEYVGDEPKQPLAIEYFGGGESPAKRRLKKISDMEEEERQIANRENMHRNLEALNKRKGEEKKEGKKEFFKKPGQLKRPAQLSMEDLRKEGRPKLARKAIMDEKGNIQNLSELLAGEGGESEKAMRAEKLARAKEAQQKIMKKGERLSEKEQKHLEKYGVEELGSESEEERDRKREMEGGGRGQITIRGGRKVSREKFRELAEKMKEKRQMELSKNRGITMEHHHKEKKKEKKKKKKGGETLSDFLKDYAEMEEEE
jgi:hypothetical protein